MCALRTIAYKYFNGAAYLMKFCNKNELKPTKRELLLLLFLTCEYMKPTNLL